VRERVSSLNRPQFFDHELRAWVLPIASWHPTEVRHRS
jgi:hypothetical protein